MISDSAPQPSRAVRNAGLALACAGATLVALLGSAIASQHASAAWPRGADLISILPGQPPATNASMQPSISADGRYVAFFSRAADLDVAAPLGGIFRKNLDTGEVSLVAKRLVGTGCGAVSRPWISGDGRYVAIETSESLVGADTNESRDVYLRDMNLGIGVVGAFELVSAFDGEPESLDFWGWSEEHDELRLASGCSVGARIPESSRAISFDGRKVLFSTAQFTNLPSGGNSPATPRAQLYLRDLSADTTTLVTRTIDDPLTPATEPAGLPIALEPEDASPLPTATISGDGTTVAWSGVEARQQTPFHAAEAETAGSGNELYYMWRRMADGPLAPTRRVTGSVDLDAPGCNATNEGADLYDNAPNVGAAADACLGPLAQKEWDSHFCVGHPPPGLDYTGRKVAYITCAELRHAGPRAGSNTPEDQEDDGPFLPVNVYGPDAFITDMSPGVTKIAGTRELTHSAGNVNAADLAGAGINRVDLSASGDRLAMVTSRASFTLPNPVPTGSMPTTKDRARGFVIDNLSTASTADDTLEWVTRSHPADTGEDLEGGISGDAALDGAGDTLVFSSLASDIFFGDGNEFSDVFATNGPAGPAFGPRVTITTPAQAQVLPSANVNVSYTAVDATSVECSLDGAAAAPCGASPVAYTDLSESAHTIAITVSDGSLSNTVIRSFSVNVPDPPVTPPVTPPPVTPPPVAPGPPAAPVATLAVGKTAALPNGTAKVAITLSGAGAVKLIGTAKLPKKKKLALQTAGTGTATAGAAGVTTVSFKLNSLAKKQLKAKGKMAVAVTVTYTPAAGSPVQQKMTIVFKAKKKK